MTDGRLVGVATQFIAAWNAHDMKAFGSLFRSDAEFVNVYGAWWTGQALIQAEHEAVHATIFRASKLIALDIRVKELASEVAHIHVHWALSGVAIKTGPLPDRTGILLLIIVRDREEWRIAAAQNTDIAAPPMP